MVCKFKKFYKGVGFLNIFGMSDIGKKRKSNQDTFSYLKLNEDVCFAFVCDGMGGQNGGDIASKMAKELLHKKIYEALNVSVERITSDYVKEVVSNCLEEVNISIFEKSESCSSYKGMGTTCATVVLVKDSLFVFSVGDSRVYLYSNYVLKQLTKDHSYVQTLVDSGKITKEEARCHPRKNEITKAVGISKNKINVDVNMLKIKEGDVTLLCTDGLTNSCSDSKLEEILKNRVDINSCVEYFIGISNFNGGYDNVTAVLIEI